MRKEKTAYAIGITGTAMRKSMAKLLLAASRNRRHYQILKREYNKIPKPIRHKAKETLK